MGVSWGNGTGTPVWDEAEWQRIAGRARAAHRARQLQLARAAARQAEHAEHGDQLRTGLAWVGVVSLALAAYLVVGWAAYQLAGLIA